MKKRFKGLLMTLVAAMGISTVSAVPQAFSNGQVVIAHADDSQIGQDDLISKSYTVKHASAAAAMNVSNGTMLFRQNANTKRRIASLSKLMTLYLAIQKANNEDAWDDVVSTKGNGLYRMGNNPSVGGFKFKPGHSYTFRELYKAALIQSSNNATIALGRWVAGSNAKFIKLMNKQAKTWGIAASFVSASGLDNNDLKPYGYMSKGSYYAGNMVSAKAILIIAKHVLDEYPAITKDSKKRVSYVDGQRLTNENRLIKGHSFYTKSLNVDGLKTGYTPAAGLCLVATNQKPGQPRLLTVVLNDNAEFTDTRDFMNFIYKNANVYNNPNAGSSYNGNSSNSNAISDTVDSND